MNETDFDALCEGASPAEAKQLRKLPADWCAGQENSFPVQLVLLTRAQWRAAATIPQSVEEARKRMEATFCEQQRQIPVLVAGFQQAVNSETSRLQRTVKEHASNTAGTISEMRLQLSLADQTAKRIATELEAASQSGMTRSRSTKGPPNGSLSFAPIYRGGRGAATGY